MSDEHALATADLDFGHADPFDRLLLGVAEADHLILLTADGALVALAGENPRLPIRGA
jgi:PIN domain nuclease of toxin-antitoxin system